MEIVSPAAQVLDGPIEEWGWRFIFEHLKNAPAGRLYGVPRGGAIVAGLTGRAVDRIEDADAVVDDIIDSGRTRDKYVAAYHKPFWALVDKNQFPPEARPWIVFPWEHGNTMADIEDTVVRQLEFIGENPLRDGLVDTPRRVVRSLTEMTSGYHEKPAEILSKVFDVPYDEMVVLRGIEFWSLCEHHLMPFNGRAHIGYLPKGKVIGISKLARLVHCFARRLQVQERLTQQIAHTINEHLQPQGVGVVLEATHLCMAMRGVRSPAEMITSCLLGNIRDMARGEFLGLVKKG